MTTMSNLDAREITSSRIIPETRERVFAAWAEPKTLARWWGPKGFRNSFERFDFRPGGEWRFVMHGPDGTDYKNHSIFLAVREPEEIVFDHVSGPRFTSYNRFEANPLGTQVQMRMLFETAEQCDRVREYILPANEENFDRLEAVLAEMRNEGNAA